MTPLSSERYAALVLRYRWPILVLATLLMLAMTGGARFIGVTNDYRSLFEADNPQLKALDALEATFATSNAALIAIAPQQGSVFTREALAGAARPGADQSGVGNALFQPGRLAHQLHP